jgi:hypothetical protein
MANAGTGAMHETCDEGGFTRSTSPALASAHSKVPHTPPSPAGSTPPHAHTGSAPRTTSTHTRAPTPQPLPLVKAASRSLRGAWASGGESTTSPSALPLAVESTWRRQEASRRSPAPAPESTWEGKEVKV